MRISTVALDVCLEELRIGHLDLPLQCVDFRVQAILGGHRGLLLVLLVFARLLSLWVSHFRERRLKLDPGEAQLLLGGCGVCPGLVIGLLRLLEAFLRCRLQLLGGGLGQHLALAFARCR